jgi:aldehyde dehydrogenase (NAD+)
LQGNVPHLYIDGEWVTSQSSDRLLVNSPSTREVLGDVPRGNAHDIDVAVRAAALAHEERRWLSLSLNERACILWQIGEQLIAHSDDVGRLTAAEGCTPLSQAIGETKAAGRIFQYYAGAVDKIQGDTIPVDGEILDYTLREPLGVTAHITPWNAPMFLVARSVAPALAAGNTVVIKPDEHTPLGILRVAEILQQAGIPAGVVNIVTGTGIEAGAPLAGHELVNGITFTGSVETGRLVARAAADNIVPVVLELGGKSPNIVFSDADQDGALGSLAAGALSVFRRAGQVCAAGTRLLLHRDIYDGFLTRLVERAKQIRVGPTLDDLDIGPIISEEQFCKVMGYIEEGRKEGARLVLGGRRMESENLRRGYFVEPTILAEVDNRWRVAQDEIFGPVLCVIPFDTEDEAVQIANDTAYGLAAEIWTGNLSRAHRVAKRIRAGFVRINGQGGPPQCPAGGHKRSGYGHELGLGALHHYTQVKNVWLAL